jgi:hypothetical protein
MKRLLMFLLLLTLCLAFIACGVDAPNAPEKKTATAQDGGNPPSPPPGDGGGG